MSESLWTFAELVEAVRGRPIGPQPATIAGVSIDSRTLAPGEVFFAIEGETFDGHDFVTMALAAGGATAVVAEAKLAALGRVTGSLVVVDDVLQALAGLGRHARARSVARLAAVTGSVGKTGTKEMLARSLMPAGSVHFSPASFNNHWGVPLTLSRLPPNADFGVFEIGMNHSGEIAPLVRLVRPHVAIVTTVAPVHLQYFDDVEDIARAKAEIFLGVEPGGTAILNRDNEFYELLAGLAEEAGIGRVIGFGAHPTAQARLENVELGSDRSRVAATIGDQTVTYQVGAAGRHIVYNSLAVLAAVVELGGDLEKAIQVLGRLGALDGRGARRRLTVGENAEALLIDESYNANPVSMSAAIALLGQAAPARSGRRIAVLGDMLELGDAASQLHVELAEPLAAAAVDLVFATGPMMRGLWAALPSERRGAYCDDAGELETTLAEALADGDVVMVKGSNASRMGSLVAGLTGRFAPHRSAVEDRHEQETA